MYQSARCVIYAFPLWISPFHMVPARFLDKQRNGDCGIRFAFDFGHRGLRLPLLAQRRSPGATTRTMRSPEHHVRMQAVFQRHSDSGVSKTINLPAHATKAEVASAFRLAYSLGCKGITVFRSGSREHQVLSCANMQYC